jgi:hypothetical protein
MHLECMEIGDETSIPHKCDLGTTVSNISNGRHFSNQSFKFGVVVWKAAVVYVGLHDGHTEKGIRD